MENRIKREVYPDVFKVMHKMRAMQYATTTLITGINDFGIPRDDILEEIRGGLEFIWEDIMEDLKVLLEQ